MQRNIETMRDLFELAKKYEFMTADLAITAEEKAYCKAKATEFFKLAAEYRESLKQPALILTPRQCSCGQWHSQTVGIVCEEGNLTFECSCGSSMLAFKGAFQCE